MTVLCLGYFWIDHGMLNTKDSKWRAQAVTVLLIWINVDAGLMFGTYIWVIVKHNVLAFFKRVWRKMCKPCVLPNAHPPKQRARIISKLVLRSIGVHQGMVRHSKALERLKNCVPETEFKLFEAYEKQIKEMRLRFHATQAGLPLPGCEMITLVSRVLIAKLRPRKTEIDNKPNENNDTIESLIDGIVSHCNSHEVQRPPAYDASLQQAVNLTALTLRRVFRNKKTPLRHRFPGTAKYGAFMSTYSSLTCSSACT